jgi:hypothetical protein
MKPPVMVAFCQVMFDDGPRFSTARLLMSLYSTGMATRQPSNVYPDMPLLSTPAIETPLWHFTVTRPLLKLLRSTSFGYEPVVKVTVSPALAWSIVANASLGVA